jgi:methionine aminopeptidase
MKTSETAFAADMLELFRRAGEVNAWRLLDQMADANDDGASREDLHRLVRDALADQPVMH